MRVAHGWVAGPDPALLYCRYRAAAGFIVFQEQEGEICLDHLYVLPEHQGSKGVGALVLRWVLERAASLGLAVRVTALRNSKANRFVTVLSC
ncbi:GNAT family N-acetyltransferase [Chromobacterium haemolyticum]|uniref:GNAT family N-acetyltransferase n=1 Tax=Chromobacterium haemolyticum TaxID=394935 RepID=UPI0040561F90